MPMRAASGCATLRKADAPAAATAGAWAADEMGYSMFRLVHNRPE